MKRFSIKTTAVLLALTMSMGLLAACSDKSDSSSEETSDSIVVSGSEDDDLITLVNHMTDTEYAETYETGFQLLDRPWESIETDDRPIPPIDGFYDMIGYEVTTKADLIRDIEEHPEEYENFESISADIYALPDDYEQIRGMLVNEHLYYEFLPAADYDGGAGQTWYYTFDPVTQSSTADVLDYDSYEDLAAKMRDILDARKAAGDATADQEYEDMTMFYDAFLAGEATQMPSGTFDTLIEFVMDNMEYFFGEDDDYSYTWEFDAAEVEAIKDYVSEYHFYDEELDMRFIAHVITPPDYDPSVRYPALVLTDAVWRFSDVAMLRGLMEKGEAEPCILITVGFEYDIDGWNNDIRASIFCDHKKEFLDFLTDNMMPFLSEKYDIDFSQTTLFGHSQGGVFSHYAAFNSDLYENRPFAKYIIGSPAFWTPYFVMNEDFGNYTNEYGYFERNDDIDFELYICGGSQEDPDYQEYYGENDSTLEGIDHLEERLTDHGFTNFIVKLYNSHHYQYLPQFLGEYIRGELVI